MDAIHTGRQALAAWKNAQPRNWFTSHTLWPLLLHRYVSAELQPEFTSRLQTFGGVMAGMDDLAFRADQPDKGPQLDRYDAIGRRQERIRFDESYHTFGAAVYGSGVMSVTGDPQRAVLQAALVHLASMHGEAGHVCPLACTAGLIKAIQRVGHPALQQGLLPRLLNGDYAHRLHGSQFLTEVQGGSDVGSNASVAELVAPETDAQPGLWAITGEKWFCSVVDAPLYLMTARPVGAASGTRGLGLFVVPHDLPADGAVRARPLPHRPQQEGPVTPNHFTIRRLKNKLGTRAMASGEVDWQGAIGWQLGPIDRGFHNVVEIVLNTSRIFNALACSGMAWRTFLVASTYAQHRTAFGHPVAQFASMDALLGELYVEAAAILASTVDLVALEASGEFGEALRLGLNMNKYWTSIQTTAVIHKGIEVLGGNGAMEDFSPLPRLYRDAMVTESWEGTHMVLAAQTHRDMQRLNLHTPWLTWMGQRVDALTGPHADELRRRLAQLQTQAADIVATPAGQDDGAVLTRHWMEQAMVVHQGVCLLELGTLPGGDKALPAAVVTHWFALHPTTTPVRSRGWWPKV